MRHFLILWRLWSLLSAALIYLVSVNAYDDAAVIAANVLSLAPQLGLVLALGCVIPLGLVTRLLVFSPPQSYDIPRLALHFAGSFLTVALPEELFFRGILLRRFEPLFARKWLPLMISSSAFSAHALE